MSIKTFISEQKFYHHFQPIYYLYSEERVGYEALIRSSVYPNPEFIFREAKKEERLYELDSRSIHKALSTYHAAGLSKTKEKLFINVLPTTILNRNFPYFLHQIISDNLMKSQEIVIEISETESIEDFNIYTNRILEIKKEGFLIAIDDVGKGYTNIQSIIELKPDYLKLDLYFSRNLHVSKEKQSFVSFYVNYCKQFKIKLILEGLETEEDLEMAKELSVEIGQGYILGKPALLK